MWIARTSSRVLALTAALGLAAPIAAATAAASPSSPLTGQQVQISAIAPGTWVAHHPLTVGVVAWNTHEQFFCSDLVISVTSWGARQVRHTTSREVPTTFGVGKAELTIPARLVRSGVLHYFASASQTCGLFEPYRLDAGSSPHASVVVLSPAAAVR